MNDSQINKIYNIICKHHKKYLKEQGVKLPKLKKNEQYTINALVLIKLTEGYPDTHVVSKEELTLFIKKYYPNSTDIQQARHLSMQSGWYINSGQRGDDGDKKIPKGSYKLITLKEKYPGFTPERRKGFSGSFLDIKNQYDNRCATCGSKEGEKHYLRKNVIVKLQQGHMDPKKQLVVGNIIPQCQICNRADRNRWIYDSTGRVIEVATTEDGRRVVETFLKKSSKEVRLSIINFLNKLLK